MSDHRWLFTANPSHDFTRQEQGKLSFYDTIRLILSMGKGNLSDELVGYFDMDVDSIPSASALVQRRQQILPSTFQYLFNEFSSSFPQTTHQFKGHCILACDGTHVVYATNSDILEDYNKPRMEDHKGYNHMHLNGFVDVISKAFLDVSSSPARSRMNALRSIRCLIISFPTIRANTLLLLTGDMNLMTSSFTVN